jgi:hypothetical protein
VVVFAQQDFSSRAAIMINEVFIFCSYGRTIICHENLHTLTFGRCE